MATGLKPARMLRALRELRIGGIETNRKRHIEMLSDPAFQAGGVDTGSSN